MVKVLKISPDRKDVGLLLKQSDNYMTSLYPPETIHLDGAEELSKSNVVLIGAFEDNNLVGIGAVKVIEHDVVYGEVKRVFIPTKHRGKGIAKLIMYELENYLVKQGVRHARLVAGVKQPEALGLYRSLGFIERGAFGQYKDDPISVFMEKILGNR